MERLFVPEVPIGYFQLTDLTASVGLAAAWNAAFPNALITSGQFVLVIDVEGGNVRWRPDGATTAPTGTVGSRLMQDTSMIYTGNNPSALRFMQEGAAVAGVVKLNVSIFRQTV